MSEKEASQFSWSTAVPMFSGLPATPIYSPMFLSTRLEDYHYYFLPRGGPQLFLWFVFLVVLPIVYFAVIRRLFTSPLKRVVAVFVFLSLCTMIAYWDVALIAWQAQRLCTQEAGLRAFRIAEVDGFKASADEEFLKQGFSYMEYERNPTHRERSSMVNGEVKRERVMELKSEYELIKDRSRRYFCCGENRYVVRNRKTGEILGQYVSFTLHRGWAARPLNFLATPDAMLCTGPEEPPSLTPKYWRSGADVVAAVLRPKQHDGGRLDEK